MTEAAAHVGPEADPPHRYKMKDLCEATGLPRQAIHFYIQQGLLRPGRKTGRNMAWYSEEHLERLRLIKKLQHEQFLPLKAIKALLDGREESFTPEQHQFLLQVKRRLSGELAQTSRSRSTVEARELLRRYPEIAMDELERAVELGLLGAARGPQGQLQIPEDDVWVVESFAQMRRVGYTRERGFTVDDVAFYEDAMSKLFQQELALVSSRLSHLPPDEAARMIERALPLIHQFITRYHAARVRDFFSSMQ